MGHSTTGGIAAATQNSGWGSQLWISRVHKAVLQPRLSRWCFSCAITNERHTFHASSAPHLRPEIQYRASTLCASCRISCLQQNHKTSWHVLECTSQNIKRDNELRRVWEAMAFWDGCLEYFWIEDNHRKCLNFYMPLESLMQNQS